MCEARYRVKILNFKSDSVGCDYNIYCDYIPLSFCNGFRYDIYEGRATSKSKRKEDPSECTQNAMASVGRK